jgi:hypothetical protein
MRGKRALSPEDEAELLRLDDLRYTLRDKNLALMFNVAPKTLRDILSRKRRERIEQAERKFGQKCGSDAAA